jgi:hypothetical protein
MWEQSKQKTKYLKTPTIKIKIKIKEVKRIKKELH